MADSKESNNLNLYNLNNYKYSGLVNKKTITIRPGKESVLIMAFTQELAASSCKICWDILTTAKENCHFCRLPCGHMFLHSVEEANMDGGGGCGVQDKSEKKFLEVGFWGGSGGKSWDDGFFDGVRAITIRFKHCICSIQVVYDKGGIPVSGNKHGNNGYDSSVEFELDYPNEYIVRVSGHVFNVENGWLVVRSLTFETNKRSFGPYGKDEGLPFTFPLVGLRIVGFKGRSEGYLDALGFHVSIDALTMAIKELSLPTGR